MNAIAISCPFEDCKHFGKIIHVELDRYKKHLCLEHDKNDLLQFALAKGIIQDPSCYHNFSYIVQKIAEGSKVNGVSQWK
ncbi:MAG: hypothetical protein WD717_03900 [Nitrosarchaeum sp.]